MPINKQTDKDRKPVFCENCEILALATLDDAPLCAGCLMCAIGNRVGEDLFDRIKPLHGARACSVKDGQMTIG